MSGTKATDLLAFGAESGRQVTTFDYQGHGLSSGDFEAGTIGQWGNDALAILDEVTEGPQILVGSSMGGWIMLLLARARPERVAALVGIAAAPDFTESLIWDQLPPDQRQLLEEKGRLEQPSAYSEEPYVITRALIEEGRSHLQLHSPIPLTCPVRLLHGLEDVDVPWETSLALADALESNDVQVTLVKGGDHSLSGPPQLALLRATLERLLTA
ncbi:MAG: alpha/beta hydrolase [Pseudomonadota bacterium]